jgi:polyprenyl-phospho-N-acetylgalactosaminyl synthase
MASVHTGLKRLHNKLIINMPLEHTEGISASNSDSLWVIVPAYNEATVIKAVLVELLDVYLNVIVIDDCSRDETYAQALETNCVVLRHPINLGQGAALQTGIDYALRRGASAIVTFDSDGQHRPEDIAVMMKVMCDTNCDVVCGSRFLGATENISTIRRLILKAAVVFQWVTAGVKLTDAHNGLRLFSRHAAEKMQLTENRMAHASQIIEQCVAAKLKINEAPVTIRYTAYSLAKGQSLFNAINIIGNVLLRKFFK